MSGMKRLLAAWLWGVVLTVSASFAGAADTNSIAGGFYRITVSTNTWQYAVVDSSKEVVTLYDKTDHALWATNVVAGLQSAPVLGERKIHGMQMYHGNLWVSVGRRYGVIDISTGGLRGFNQD